MDQIQLAQQICQEAHFGQVDKAGKPYYLHPFAVADMCETEEEKGYRLPSRRARG